MTSRVEELYIQTRNHPVCGYLIPLESVVAYPIPANEGNAIFLKFLVYQRGWSPRGTPKPVYPPHARIAIEYPSGKLVEYLDLTYKNQIDPVGEYPHSSIANLSVKDILALQTDFYALTEALIPLIGHPDPSSEEKEIVKRYKGLAEILMEPSLNLYYRELNPGFFEWLDLIMILIS